MTYPDTDRSSTMSKGFKRISKCKINSPKYSHLLLDLRIHKELKGNQSKQDKNFPWMIGWLIQRNFLAEKTSLDKAKLQFLYTQFWQYRGSKNLIQLRSQHCLFHIHRIKIIGMIQWNKLNFLSIKINNPIPFKISASLLKVRFKKPYCCCD